MKRSTDKLILAPDAAIDLHMHTIYSDGDWIPEQLLDYLVSEHFGLAAITDHDRTDTAARLQQLAAEKQLPVLVATEMSTTWKGELTDILCYGFDPYQGALAALAQAVRRRQQENTREVYENLCRNGYTFSETLEGTAPTDELAAILEKPSDQHPHQLVALLKRYGYGTGDTPAGRIVLDAGGIFATTDLADVVEATHQDGGVCLVAHPGRGNGLMLFDERLLDQLRQETPIDGLEVYHPAHTSEQITMYLDYARKYDLLVSSGSDSHRPSGKPIPYRADLSRKLLERLGIQINAMM